MGQSGDGGLPLQSKLSSATSSLADPGTLKHRVQDSKEFLKNKVRQWWLPSMELKMCLMFIVSIDTSLKVYAEVQLYMLFVFG